jgi:hypothetical protein
MACSHPSWTRLSHCRGSRQGVLKLSPRETAARSTRTAGQHVSHTLMRVRILSVEASRRRAQEACDADASGGAVLLDTTKNARRLRADKRSTSKMGVRRSYATQLTLASLAALAALAPPATAQGKCPDLEYRCVPLLLSTLFF